MGQRTQIVLKKINAKGESKTQIFHFQWGYGRVMPAAFIAMVNSQLVEYDFETMTIPTRDARNDSWSDSALNGIDFDAAHGVIIANYIRTRFDNNNGALVIECRAMKNGRGFDCHCAFVLGDEDLDFSSDKSLRGFVSADDYFTHAGGSRYIDDGFRAMYKGFCEHYDINPIQ